ncbi:MAG: hypothetical protein DDT42_01177 [candidate division WS2 bacterium]|uniref:DUF7982 domain-containing protein n=1 Tax=Psychracetigena formicireducens TaxID=2986056 RepID=A0A9E2BGW7_PSYF1|nr:hypothetical protein [Candidatus Psychracetigena formicireducens]MBT9145307.1 hypothetical protein [Candidatus Psychracetigena formicireducens]
MRYHSYFYLGIALLIIGSLTSLASYFILQQNWITAFGLSLIILSIILFAINKAVPSLSPEAGRLLFQVGLENLASLIEELNINSKAVYLPSSYTSAKQPQALIPLHRNPQIPKLNQVLSKRFIVRYGNNPEEVGLLLSTPGSIAMDMWENKPGSTAGELESALIYLLRGILDVANGVRVTMKDSLLYVEVFGFRWEKANYHYHQCLGSPVTSLIASTVAEAFGKPVIIVEEQNIKSKLSIKLELQNTEDGPLKVEVEK